MRYVILALFVAVATAAPIEDNGPVELIVNGVPEGQPIDLSDVVDIKVKEHNNGEVVATNLLHPYTAAGIAEAAAAAVIPEPVVLPSPVVPVPEPVILPSPVAPEVHDPLIPESMDLPEPEVFPQPVVLPDPVAPEVVIVAPEPVVLPDPVAPEVASLPNGEIFNDGTVSVTVNTPQEAGVLSTIQSWFSLVLNYISGETQTSHQIV